MSANRTNLPHLEPVIEEFESALRVSLQRATEVQEWAVREERRALARRQFQEGQWKQIEGVR